MQAQLNRLNSNLEELNLKIQNLTGALSTQAPVAFAPIDWHKHTFAIWQDKQLSGFSLKTKLSLYDLYGIDDQKQAFEKNILKFLYSKPFNYILLTGARGMGKSSLVGAILQKYHEKNLRLVQVGREELTSLTQLFSAISKFDKYKFIVFFDDLSFEKNDADYKNLKSILDNGFNLVPENACIVATSNRKHLLPEKMADNLESINEDLRPSDTIEETMSLADRFGLWLSFYAFNQEDYLATVKLWLEKLGTKNITYLDEKTQLEALRFATRRGIRNGRMAKHFATYWLGVF